MAASVSHDGPSFGRGRRKADAPARRGAGQGSAPGGPCRFYTSPRPRDFF